MVVVHVGVGAPSWGVLVLPALAVPPALTYLQRHLTQ